MQVVRVEGRGHRRAPGEREVERHGHRRAPGERDVERCGHHPAPGEQEAGQPVFYYDLGDPACYLAAERVMSVLPAVAEWEPVWAPWLADTTAESTPAPARTLTGTTRVDPRPLTGTTGAHPRPLTGTTGAHPRPLTGSTGAHPRPASWPEGQRAREWFECQAAAHGLQPFRWPARPPHTREAMLAATYAKQIGRTVAFSLAAFRQTFAAGRDLGERDTLLIAGAACEMHPAALLKALQLRSVLEALEAATARAAAAGVRTLPAIRVGDRVFAGDGALERAAEAIRPAPATGAESGARLPPGADRAG